MSCENVGNAQLESIAKETPKSILNGKRKYRYTKKCQWSPWEHESYLKAVNTFGYNWERISEYIGTKNPSQVRSHNYRLGASKEECIYRKHRTIVYNYIESNRESSFIKMQKIEPSDEIYQINIEKDLLDYMRHKCSDLPSKFTMNLDMAAWIGLELIMDEYLKQSYCSENLANCLSQPIEKAGESSAETASNTHPQVIRLNQNKSITQKMKQVVNAFNDIPKEENVHKTYYGKYFEYFE